jgi:hypothetical protein
MVSPPVSADTFGWSMPESSAARVWGRRRSLMMLMICRICHGGFVTSNPEALPGTSQLTLSIQDQ